MEKNNFNFSQYYQFECDNNLVEEIKAELLSDKVIKRDNSSNFTLKNHELGYYNEKLLNYLEDCLKEVSKDLFLADGVDLKVVACWGNISTRQQAHHKHTHSNSFLSGILYLTTHESGFTYFNNLNYFFEKFSTLSITKSNTHTHKIKPEAGKLIMFPSHIEHGVTGLTTNETRLTISFNAFPTGKIGKLSTDLYLSSPSMKELVQQQNNV